jgi:predicted nucleic acid-binding protein
MAWLLDTNAVSELKATKINQGFAEWWAPINRDDAAIFLCAPVMGELLRGALLLDPASPKQRSLLRWLTEDVEARFQGRILPFDHGVARTWSKVAAKFPKNRFPPVLDSYIAAIAIHHDLTLVTRDVADMKLFVDLKIVSPWS